jgi:hypothetical protein
MGKPAGAHIAQIDAPHLSMISNPAAVTSVVLQAVRSLTQASPVRPPKLVV